MLSSAYTLLIHVKRLSSLIHRGTPCFYSSFPLSGKEGFSSCLGHHYGTGYSANLKPAGYYSPSRELLHNPNLGSANNTVYLITLCVWFYHLYLYLSLSLSLSLSSVSLLDSFQSQTKRHYQPLTVPNGAEALPSTRDKSRESGYLQLHTQPRPVRIISPLYFCVCATVYRKHQMVGAKEESGFTEGTNLQYNILLPQDTPMAYNSVYFHSYCFSGNEVLPKLVAHAPRETAFTRDAQELLRTCPDSPVPACPHGHRQKSLLFAERSIGRKSVRSRPVSSVLFQEGSGFILNTPILKTLSDTPYDPLQFLSHYHSKFCNKAGFDTLKAGWNRGGIHKHRDSGYSGRDTDRYKYYKHNYE
ncbi:protein phosphatase 1 regulatory subunit 32 [Ictalurus furcatus]|uniref:protein phosphatase 1 regulatory subunit 32 n=1 Tax=Ictalurus furcatus TaxID=66913 RepID=UPI0023505620|nr:protein phosphatase 1 regulatory subunit 32 [Ictalurus furcatus]